MEDREVALGLASLRYDGLYPAARRVVGHATSGRGTVSIVDWSVVTMTSQGNGSNCDPRFRVDPASRTRPGAPQHRDTRSAQCAAAGQYLLAIRAIRSYLQEIRHSVDAFPMSLERDPVALVIHHGFPVPQDLGGALTVVAPRGRSGAGFLLLGLGVVTAAYVGMLMLSPGGHDRTIDISDIVMTLAASIASLSCALTGRRHAGGMRAFWWLLAAACASWATGEAIWSWYEVVRGVEVPYPSWADVGYLIGTPLAVAAFASHPAAHSRAHRQRLLPLLDGIAAATALLFVSWTLVLSPLWGQNGGMSLGDLIAVAYPFGDVVVLFLIVLAVRNLPSGNRPATGLLLTGLLVMAVTDSAYTYLAQVGAYSSGDLIDAGWLLAYLAIAAAGRVYESPTDARAPQAQSSAATVLAIVGPYVPIIVALAVLAVELPRGRHLDRVETVIAAILIVLVLARQLVNLVQTRRATAAAAEAVTRVPTRGLYAPGDAWPVGAPESPVGQHGHRRVGTATDTQRELQGLTLDILAASRESSQQRVHRVSGRLVMTLTSAAAVLAVWDLSLLVRGAVGGAS